MTLLGFFERKILLLRRVYLIVNYLSLVVLIIKLLNNIWRMNDSDQ